MRHPGLVPASHVPLCFHVTSAGPSRTQPPTFINPARPQCCPQQFSCPSSHAGEPSPPATSFFSQDFTQDPKFTSNCMDGHLYSLTLLCTRTARAAVPHTPGPRAARTSPRAAPVCGYRGLCHRGREAGTASPVAPTSLPQQGPRQQLLLGPVLCAGRMAHAGGEGSVRGAFAASFIRSRLIGRRGCETRAGTVLAPKAPGTKPRESQSLPVAGRGWQAQQQCPGTGRGSRGWVCVCRGSARARGVTGADRWSWWVWGAASAGPSPSPWRAHGRFHGTLCSWAGSSVGVCSRCAAASTQIPTVLALGVTGLRTLLSIDLAGAIVLTCTGAQHKPVPPSRVLPGYRSPVQTSTTQQGPAQLPEPSTNLKNFFNVQT